MRKKERTVASGPDASASNDVWTAVPRRSWWGRASVSDAPPDAAPDDPLAADHNDASAAHAEWADRLARYVDQQGPMDALRLRPPSEPPWPQTANPMLGYLIERSSEIARDDGLDAALEWIGTNAWFEGVIAERVRIARLLDDA